MRGGDRHTETGPPRRLEWCRHRPRTAGRPRKPEREGGPSRRARPGLWGSGSPERAVYAPQFEALVGHPKAVPPQAARGPCSQAAPGPSPALSARGLVSGRRSSAWPHLRAALLRSPRLPPPRLPWSVPAVRAQTLTLRTASLTTSPDAWCCAVGVPSRAGPAHLLHAIPRNGPPRLVLRDGRTLPSPGPLRPNWAAGITGYTWLLWRIPYRYLVPAPAPCRGTRRTQACGGAAGPNSLSSPAPGRRRLRDVSHVLFPPPVPHGMVYIMEWSERSHNEIILHLFLHLAVK